MASAGNEKDRKNRSTSLPEDRVSSGAGARDAETSKAPATRAEPERRAVMVVDDDPDTQTYMATVLARNYGVVMAAGGAEMWSQLETHPGGINLILMDLTLAGGEDGIELTRQLRAHSRWSSIPVVALTAHASDEVRNRALAAGCEEYICKPIDRRRLFAMIDALMQRNQ